MASMDVGANGPDRIDERARAALRSLPSVDRLAREVLDSSAHDGEAERLVTAAARAAIEDARHDVLGGAEPTGMAELIDRVRRRLERDRAPVLGPVINATGVLLHTGLGRAPLGPALRRAAEALEDAYAPVELDMASGARGKRRSVVEPLLRELTGAEAATVVNNNAAAMVVTLGALAGGREVIVSRGELVEIGGSFRLPEIIETGGARLREVGTTNRTRADDYARAIGPETGALLKVHPSNYRVEGFSDEATIEEVVRIGREYGLPVVHDIGSGVLTDALRNAFGVDEPTATGSLRAGADLVLFSADKMLGGPQAGVIVGRADLVDRVERQALMRAIRVDKLTLGVLGETLRLLRDPDAWERAIPALAMARRPVESLREDGEAIVAALRGAPGLGDIAVVESVACVGAGSAPGAELPSVAVRVEAAGTSESELASRLRRGTPAVVARVQDGAVLLDLRAVRPRELAPLLEALARALAGP